MCISKLNLSNRSCSALSGHSARERASISPRGILIAATIAPASRPWRNWRTRASLPLVATNAVLYHAAHRRPLQDVLTCIREKCTIHEAGLKLEANAERHLKAAAGNGAAVRRP